LAAGCSDYILKPFNPAELMKKISAALDLPIPAEILKRMEN
jgi:DNA-binding response OmpR family regulator